MKFSVTNHTLFGTLVSSKDEGGWTELLNPMLTVNVDRAATNDAVVGDKPDVIDNIEQGLKTLGAIVRAVLTAIIGRRTDPGSPADDRLDVTVANDGANAIRAILGDGVTDLEIAPGASERMQATGYIELRELGLVQQPPGQVEAP